MIIRVHIETMLKPIVTLSVEIVHGLQSLWPEAVVQIVIDGEYSEEWNGEEL
jgi:hypothetical protein